MMPLLLFLIAGYSCQNQNRPGTPFIDIPTRPRTQLPCLAILDFAFSATLYYILGE
jgi:hypothetical protein